MPEFMDIRSHETLGKFHLPYALRRVPRASVAGIQLTTRSPRVGDLALAQVVDIGRTTRIELDTGRMSTLYAGTLLGVVFGHRYATGQYEAYASAEGDRCDLLTAAGVCGLVESKQETTKDPTKLIIVGYLCDDNGGVLNLKEFALEATSELLESPPTVVVCGSTMNSGKTHTASAIIRGLVEQGHRVGASKITGTAAGKDVWNFLDAGAFDAIDFSDCGYPSTVDCSFDELMTMHNSARSHLIAGGADRLVVEIADGVLQRETELLLRNPAFTGHVDQFVFATGDPVSAAGGVTLLRSWGIEPTAVSGIVTRSPLAIREAEEATGVRCITVQQLIDGGLGDPEPVAFHGTQALEFNGNGKYTA